MKKFPAATGNRELLTRDAVLLIIKTQSYGKRNSKKSRLVRRF